jgi:hypothetical protein
MLPSTLVCAVTEGVEGGGGREAQGVCVVVAAGCSTPQGLLLLPQYLASYLASYLPCISFCIYYLCPSISCPCLPTSRSSPDMLCARRASNMLHRAYPTCAHPISHHIRHNISLRFKPCQFWSPLLPPLWPHCEVTTYLLSHF